MSTFDTETGKKLDRQAELRLITDALMTRSALTEQEMESLETALAEYRGLQEQRVEEFLPLVERLVRAGLLTCSLDLGEDASEFESVDGTADEAFPNGNIWILSGQVCSGVPRDASKSEAE